MASKIRHLHPTKRVSSLPLLKKIAYLILIVFVVLGVLAGGLYVKAQNLDSENETLLRNIAADFIVLKESIKTEAGAEVEDKSGCFTTSEKFGGGKTACYFELESIEETEIERPDIILELVETILSDDGLLLFRENGYRFTYEKWSCNVAASQLGYYVECPIPVRAKNKDLVNQLFAR